MLNINWNQVLTTVISTFLAAIIVGAAAVVWKGATTVDTTVKTATQELERTIKFTVKAVDVVEKEIAVSRDREDTLKTDVDEIKIMLFDLQKKSSKITEPNPFVELEPVKPLEENPLTKIPVFPLERNNVATKGIRVDAPIDNSRIPIQQQLPQWIYEREKAKD